MSLSKGSGPFGENRIGTGNYRIDSPKHILHFDPSPKRVRGFFAGEVIVDSTRAKVLHETGHLPVYYFPLDDLRGELLEVSGQVTECAYKGRPVHYSAPQLGDAGKHIAWCYENPQPEAEKVKGFIAFYNERIDLEIDGRKLER